VIQPHAQSDYHRNDTDAYNDTDKRSHRSRRSEDVKDTTTTTTTAAAAAATTTTTTTTPTKTGTNTAAAATNNSACNRATTVGRVASRGGRVARGRGRGRGAPSSVVDSAVASAFASQSLACGCQHAALLSRRPERNARGVVVRLHTTAVAAVDAVGGVRHAHGRLRTIAAADVVTATVVDVGGLVDGNAHA
jgi:hypothetical protein